LWRAESPRVLILRGVAELVDAPGGDPTYHAADA
jgi:hypothetical protein